MPKTLGFHAGYRIVSLALSAVAKGELPGDRRLDEFIPTGAKRDRFVQALGKQLKARGVKKTIKFDAREGTTLNQFATMLAVLPATAAADDPD